MKRVNKFLTVIVLAAVFVISSCGTIARDYEKFAEEYNDKSVVITPTESAETMAIEVSDFDAINLKFGFIDVEYSQSDAEPTAQLICSKEIMQIINVYVADGILHIKRKDNPIDEKILIDGNYECKLICNSKQLKRINQHSGGNITLKTGIKSNELEIERSGLGDLECLQPLDIKKLHISSSGSGSTYLCGTFDRLEIKTSGLGDLNFNGPLSTKYMSIKKSGSGSVNMTENVDVETLKIESSGLGDIKMQGKIDNATIDMSGSGSMESNLLKVKSLTIKKSGLGTISMHTLEGENIELVSSGSGSTSINSLKAESIDISCSGLGGMYINEGTVGTATIDYSGNSWFNADGLDADNVKFEASGMGKHTIGKVKKSLDVTLHNGVSLTYSGKPSEVKENISKNAVLKNK